MEARQRLTAKLGYSFEEPRLLDEALTHRSVSGRNNERLEFLGDAALNFVIAAELYVLEKDAPEGDLSRLRASLVKGETLAIVARQLDLGSFLSLGSGELKSGGANRDSILADALEAILGAVYLDGGFDKCRGLIRTLFAARLDARPKAVTLKDSKTLLQESLQSRQLCLPVYRVLEETGVAHKRLFKVSCEMADLGLQTFGTGTSRRKAEQAAAASALEQVVV